MLTVRNISCNFRWTWYKERQDFRQLSKCVWYGNNKCRKHHLTKSCKKSERPRSKQNSANDSVFIKGEILLSKMVYM